MLAWLRDDAGLRPVAVARTAGLTPDALAQWAAGTWAPAPVAIPLLPALETVRARALARIPDERARRTWWRQGQRESGWLSPAELLRRGKIGEVLVLLTSSRPDDPAF